MYAGSTSMQHSASICTPYEYRVLAKLHMRKYMQNGILTTLYACCCQSCSIHRCQMTGCRGQLASKAVW